MKALRLDLIGPGPEDELVQEQLPGWRRPSNWYLTGFLVPTGTPEEFRGAPDSDEQLSALPEVSGLSEDLDEEEDTARRGFFPSSMGLSFLAHPDEESVGVNVRWGEYDRTVLEREQEEDLPAWIRSQRGAQVTVLLARSDDPVEYDVPDSGGLKLFVTTRVVDGVQANLLPAGTWSVSIFLVNERTPVEGTDRDRAIVFQAEVEVSSNQGFVPRPNLRTIGDGDWDDRVADLHYADAPEYATGHGVSATWDLTYGECHRVRTDWLPAAEVERTETSVIPGVELSMDALGDLNDGSAARSALTPLVEGYRSWIDDRTKELGKIRLQSRRETAEELLRRASLAANRMERGSTLWPVTPTRLTHSEWPIRAVARALRHPPWHGRTGMASVPACVHPPEPGRDRGSEGSEP